MNKIGFSLKELSLCNEPLEYRMVFISENSDQVKYELTKQPVNLSSRLQVFEIAEGQEIDFAVDGYYSYEIYQTTSNNLVEVGLLRVYSDSDISQIITISKDPQVYGS